MVYCYFDNDYKNSYNCEYYFENKELCINVDFGNVSDELLGSTFNNKDKFIHASKITLIDEINKFYIRTFFAFEVNYKTTFGHPFVRMCKLYKTKSYFKATHAKDLDYIDFDTNITNLIFYHECLDVFCDNKARQIIHDKDLKSTNISLNMAEMPKRTFRINKNNIKNVYIESCWSAKADRFKYNIEYNNRLNIELKKEIDINSIFIYRNFISTMFNIFSPCNKPFYKTLIKTKEKLYFEFVYENFNYIPDFNITINNSIHLSISDYINNFIKIFSYKTMNSNTLNCFKVSDKLYAEDMFLIFYRFLELTLKKQNHSWLEDLIQQNKNLLKHVGLKYSKMLPFFVISLRNHYIHQGYYIDNNLIAIKGYNGKRKRVTGDIIVGFSRLTKGLAYKTLFNEVLSLNIKDEDFIHLI